MSGYAFQSFIPFHFIKGFSLLSLTRKKICFQYHFFFIKCSGNVLQHKQLFYLYKKQTILKVTLIQAPLVWENPQSNLYYFEVKILEITLAANLIVPPTMFKDGFTMNPERVAESMDGETVL